MKLLLDAGTAAVHVVEVPVARGEAEPLRHLVVAEHVEAQPVAILPIAGRLADRDADLARGHVLLAAVDQLAGEHEAARGLPHGVEVDDPARAMAVRGLLGPPAGADAEVEETISGERREADAAAVGLVLVVVVERVVGRLVLPSVDDPRLRIEPRRELVGEVEPGAALRTAELEDLRGCCGEVQDVVVALEAERQVETRQRDRRPVADRRDRGEVELVERGLRRRRLRPEALTGEGRGAAHSADAPPDQVAVLVAVALDLPGGPRAEPVRQPLRHARLARLLEPVEPLVETTNFFPQCLRFRLADALGSRHARGERDGQDAREDRRSDDGTHARLLFAIDVAIDKGERPLRRPRSRRRRSGLTCASSRTARPGGKGPSAREAGPGSSARSEDGNGRGAAA